MINDGSKTGMLFGGGWRILILVVATSFGFTPSGVDAFLCSTRRHSHYHSVLSQSSSLRTTKHSPLAHKAVLRLQTPHHLHHSLPSSFPLIRRGRQKSFERCHALWQSHEEDYSIGRPTSGGSTTTTVLLEKFAKDLQNLSQLRPNLPAADFSAPTALISAGSSYTRLWTFGTWQRHGVGPHRRYFKHVKTWRLSTSARKILPAVGLSSLYSILVALGVVQWWHYMTTSSSTAAMASTTPPLFVLSLAQGSASAMAALGAPLALLLTLRANASLGRLNEARQAWGKLLLRSRNLAALWKVYVWPHHPQCAIWAARHLVVYGWSLKALVREESWKSQQEVYQTMLSDIGTNNDHEDPSIHNLLLKNQQQPQDLPPPIVLSLSLRHIVAQVAAENISQPNFLVPHTAMEKALEDLDAVTGICQRLSTSPIPPTYSRHLSRIMVMYLLLLPWAMIANLGPTRHLLPWIVGWTSALVSYVLIGVDEIGNEIENPFPLLPLQQLSANLQNVVGAHFLIEHSTTDDSDTLSSSEDTTASHPQL